MPSIKTLSFKTASRFVLHTMMLILGFTTSQVYANTSKEVIPPKEVVEAAAMKMTARLISDKDQIARHDYYVEHLVDELLLPVVDHVYMAKKVLAKHWKKTSNEQKRQFISAFKHKVIRTYAGAFKAFNGEKIVFDEARFSRTGKSASVDSAIQRIGAPAIKVTYKLFLKEDEWLTYDVVIEGVSLVKSFRDQFNQSIEKHGLAQAISLLAAEYKSETPKLKMAGHTWEPYISNQLPANGLVVNLVTTIFERAGYQVEMEFMPWQRVSDGLSTGDIDISVGSWYNETRAKEHYFTEAYLENELVIIKRTQDKLSFNTPQEFKDYVAKRGYRLGVIKDYGYGKLFDEIAPHVAINYFKYDTSMLRDLASKKTDIALIDRWSAETNFKNNKNIADHLEIIPTTLIKQGLHATISLQRPDHKEIGLAFNKTLAEMKKDGSYNKILMTYNFPKLEKQ